MANIYWPGEVCDDRLVGFPLPQAFTPESTNHRYFVLSRGNSSSRNDPSTTAGVKDVKQIVCFSQFQRRPYELFVSIVDEHYACRWNPVCIGASDRDSNPLVRKGPPDFDEREHLIIID